MSKIIKMSKLRAKIALAIPMKYRHLYHKLECALGLHIKVKSAHQNRIFCLICEKKLK